MLSNKGKILNRILIIFMLALSILFLFPIIWMVVNSFKPDAMITQDMKMKNIQLNLI